MAKKLTKKQTGGKVKDDSTPKYKSPFGKATKDSTQYYQDKAKDMLQAYKNTGNEKWKKEGMDAAKNVYRQKFKGKPGFDANGFPIKKTGGSVKATVKRKK